MGERPFPVSGYLKEKKCSKVGWEVQSSTSGQRLFASRRSQLWWDFIACC